MKSKKLALIIYVIFIMFVIISNFSIVNADNISGLIWGSETWSLANAGNYIVGIIKWFGVAILIGAIIVKGIKFVSASPDGQASIKKELVMLTIGAVLLFTFTSIIEIIYDAVVDAGLQ